MSRPFILGLTGSIGMGKSATAEMFRNWDVPVHDSDAAVHLLYSSGGAAAKAFETVFPDAIKPDGFVDREKLRSIVLETPEAMQRLEAIVHPLVRAETAKFIERHAAESLVVLDIPLLFETGAEKRCDAVLVVSAPPDVQRERVLARPGMTPDAFERLLARQLPDAQKRQRADFVLDTSLGFDHARAEIGKLVASLRERSFRHTGQ